MERSFGARGRERNRGAQKRLLQEIRFPGSAAVAFTVVDRPRALPLKASATSVEAQMGLSLVPRPKAGRIVSAGVR